MIYHNAPRAIVTRPEVYIRSATFSDDNIYLLHKCSMTSTVFSLHDECGTVEKEFMLGNGRRPLTEHGPPCRTGLGRLPCLTRRRRADKQL